MMVPVSYDFERGKTLAWVILGWSETRLVTTFCKPPRTRVFNAAGKPADREVDIKYEERQYGLAVPEFAEVHVSRILDRDEFRAHCDRYQTRSKILEHLG